MHSTFYRSLSRKVLLSFVVLASTAQAFAQKKVNTRILGDIKSNVEYLSSDMLKGRLVGSPEEKMAANFIAEQFKDLGLKPLNKAYGWFQDFQFSAHYKVDVCELQVEATSFNGNNSSATIYPLVFSGTLAASDTVLLPVKSLSRPGMYRMAIRKDTAHCYALADLSAIAASNPHATSEPYRVAITNARAMGAKGLIIYGNTDSLTVRQFRHLTNVSPEQFPIIVVHKQAWDVLFRSFEPLTLSISVKISQPKITGRNVIGYIDRKATQTIVVGAHYDHLGMNEFGNSLHRGLPGIHNGADDNASGVASMLAIAALAKKDGLRNFNICFVAFSGEELGLLGSKYFVDNYSTLSSTPMAAMMNMDMVGRLVDSTMSLGIFGTGTSSIWDSLITQINDHSTEPFTIQRNESGMGSSDHTSFYLGNIPALHFFTGFHPDYHKPSDDADKINSLGIYKVSAFIYELMEQIDNYKLSPPFSKTASPSTTTPAFKVTLGIVPDYFYDPATAPKSADGKPAASGLRVDGVSAGKPAEKGGIMKGDIITGIKDCVVRDITTYMECLAASSKGERVTVSFYRNGQLLKTEITF